MRLIQVFEALEEQDKTEGRGSAHSLGLFLHRPDAERAAKGKGVMGHDGRIATAWLATEDGKTGYIVGIGIGRPPQPLTVAGSYMEAVRQRVRDMLTDEEWAALGIKE